MLPTPDLSAVREVAARVLRVAALYPEQEEALAGILAGRDVLVVLPTGAGKSLLYQAPALLASAPTVVVSPLLSLMRDQEVKLVRAGAPVVRLDSTLKAAERRAALARLGEGGALIVLTTPETLSGAEIRAALAQNPVARMVVDEAHCISEWGHDFRPSYLQLGVARRALGDPPLLALTATATARVRGEIETALAMVEPVRVVAPPHRRNLRLVAQSLSESDKPAAAGNLLRRLGRPGIVYCSTTAAVDLLYGALRKAGIPAVRYHGKMKAAERNAQQKKFMNRWRRLVMVATSAFGLGIDKRNIRYILHYQAPGSLEQYVQEAGRAGRDGQPAYCVLLFSPDDLKTYEYLLSRSRSSGAQLSRVAEALKAWASEGKPVSAKELALSAQAPASNAAAIAGALAEVGAVVVDEDDRYAGVSDDFDARVEDLARRLETLRTQDARRLRAVRDYVESDECRSVFLRKYFGEEAPPNCGVCDRCAQPLERLSQRRESDQARPPRPPSEGKPCRRRRRGGRRGRGRSPSGSPPPSTPPPGTP